MSISEATAWLFSQFPSYQKVGASAYKPSLNNTFKLAEYFGNPQNSLTFIHIAGTNGKGSTSSMLASTFTEAGYKTGLFTSPHLLDFRERIRVNGVMIESTFVIEFVEKIKQTPFQFDPSFFEITWVMTLLYFAQQKCEICIIETGLGGRLDSTNIITPMLSIITNIGMDHLNFLGNTLELIAIEKAGIIKKAIPCVIGQTKSETKPIFEKTAKLLGSPIFFSEEYSYQTPEKFKGSFQELNYRTFRTAMKFFPSKEFIINEEIILSAMENLESNTGFRGRMEIVNENPFTIIDVGHNADGIIVGFEALKLLIAARPNKMNGKITCMYACANDKELSEILPLFPIEYDYIFSQFPGIRAMEASKIKKIADTHGLNSSIDLNPKKAMIQRQKQMKCEDTLFIFGSFFLISELI